MKLSPRDRRALLLLAAAVAVAAVVYVAAPAEAPAPVRPVADDDIPAAEKRLARLRLLAASVPGKQEVLRAVTAELESREKGIIRAETGPQAQARVLEIVRRAAKALPSALEIRGIELGPIRPYGEEYGEAIVSVSLECRIEELINLLAEIASQPEMVALQELRISAGDAKKKTLNARVTVSGIVPRSLVPEKKGLGRF
ncbi:MAG: GspMb/PilO family protein [Bryobacterales bacterium]|nr:GspMb/PilO family protein [Bryobacteraceae bacterium]MDW8131188.1 GspMb/PilO family protein [Bryobacterales bacterium]